MCEKIRCAWAGEIPIYVDYHDKELKKLGFKFVGATIVYAFMQATDMVNDHVTSCFVYQDIQRLENSHVKSHV